MGAHRGHRFRTIQEIATPREVWEAQCGDDRTKDTVTRMRRRRNANYDLVSAIDDAGFGGVTKAGVAAGVVGAHGDFVHAAGIRRERCECAGADGPLGIERRLAWVDDLNPRLRPERKAVIVGGIGWLRWCEG